MPSDEVVGAAIAVILWIAFLALNIWLLRKIYSLARHQRLLATLGMSLVYLFTSQFIIPAPLDSPLGLLIRVAPPLIILAGGILISFRNWLAQRNIGAAMGLQWDPAKDEGFQRKMKHRGDDLAAVQAIQVTLPGAHEALEQQNFEKAHRLASSIVGQLSTSSSSFAQDAVREAQQILEKTRSHVAQADPKKSSDDYFSEANALYRQLKFSVGDTKQLRGELAQIAHLCQLAIEKDSHNGDAHVMLAGAYFLLALNGLPGSNLYNYCEPKAGAVIHRWQTAPMYTRNKSIGQKAYNDIVGHLTQRYPTLDPSMWATLNDSQYFGAVDPRGFAQLEKILSSDE